MANFSNLSGDCYKTRSLWLWISSLPNCWDLAKLKFLEYVLSLACESNCAPWWWLTPSLVGVWATPSDPSSTSWPGDEAWKNWWGDQCGVMVCGVVRCDQCGVVGCGGVWSVLGGVVVSCDQSGKVWIIWSKSYNIAGAESMSQKKISCNTPNKDFPFFYEI